MQSTIEVRILAKIPEVSEMLVPNPKHSPQMSIFSSVGHNMTTY